MKHIGLFTEMKVYADSGSIKDNIVDKVDYDKNKIISYMLRQNKIASCPRAAIDCLTGKKIADSFAVYSDGEYDWCDFLIYHIEKYNIKLPKEFIEKAKAS